MANAPTAAVPASYLRNELRQVLPLYQVIDDVLAGSVAVKYRRSKYLPMPNAVDTSKDNLARFDAYLTRAVFYAVTRRVLGGFVGEIFGKEPTITVPEMMKDIISDATGEGVGAIQLAKETSNVTLSKGRCGLFVDYPNTNGVTTKLDMENGVRPVIRFYEPTKIINWRTTKIGAKTKLSLIVLEEEYDRKDDGFQLTKGRQWRVLRLNNDGFYTVAIYRDDSGNRPVNENGTPGAEIMPRDASGAPFDEIPFTFVGSETNDSSVDYPPMFDMADLNLAHYRNSADYEEAVYMVGQPTPVVVGLTQEWADRYFGKGVGLGSRAVVTLPVGADAKLLEVAETSMAKEAMEQKERQMVALGAQIVEQRSVQRTATEASTETSAEKSVLSSVADNVSTAMEWALYFCARYMGVKADGENKITFQLNREFNITFSTAEERKEVIDAWVAEAISFTEMRAALRRGGLATLTDEQAKQEIEDARADGVGPINQRALLDQNQQFEQNNNQNDPNATTSAGD